MCSHRHRSSYRSAARRDPNLRASDADRERASDTLREQAGEGRLDPDELERRLERAYAAVTLGDLDEIVSDLPRREPARERHGRRGWAFQPIVVMLAVVAAVSIAVGHPVLWVLIPLFFLWRKPYFAPHWRRV